MKKLIYAYISKKYMNGCSEYNPLSVRKACRTKEQSRQAFEALQIPHAKGTGFFLPFKAWDFVAKQGYPVVIKPNVSGYSRGAYFPITNKQQMREALIGVKKWWPKSVIEQYLLGRNFRIVVTKQGIMSVIQRYPPFVIGDGESSIETLIDAENNIKTAMKLYPAMYPTSKGKEVQRYLKRQGLTLQSIPAKDERIYVHNKVALKLGGIVEIIDKTELTDNNVKQLMRVLNHFNANILGIDLICEEGLHIDFDKQRCFFLELNSRPYLRMHHYPRYGTLDEEDMQKFYQVLDQIQIDDGDTF